MVPRHRAREVAEVAQKIEVAESAIRELIIGGTTLRRSKEKAWLPRFATQVKNGSAQTIVAVQRLACWAQVFEADSLYRIRMSD